MIAGSARGMKLKALDGLAVRPTLDRVKESVFNMLTGYVEQANTLDLFAGSGALGIEALSRGAAHCDFVDLSSLSIKTARENLEQARLLERASLIESGFEVFLKHHLGQYNLVLLDPPYGKGFLERALTLLREREMLADDGVIVCELDAKETFDPMGFSVYRDKKYGRVRIVLLKL